MIWEIIVPHFGGTGGDVTIDEWLVQAGQYVEAGTPIFIAATDKANLQVEAFRSGYVRRLLAPPGGQVGLGEVIALMTDAPDEPLAAAPSSLIPGPAQTQATAAESAGGLPATGRILASPLARSMALAENLDLAGVAGSGPGGRIIKRDIEKALLARAPELGTNAAVPVRPTVGEGRGRRLELSAMRLAIGERTRRSKAESPHFYVSRVIDVTELETFRRSLKELASAQGWASPTLTDLVIRASALALRRVPELNVRLDGNAVEFCPHINVGFVVSVRDGVLVPVVHRADDLNLYGMAARTRMLRDQASAGQLSAADLEGGTFTVSNLGMHGVDSFIAVINPPEAAILALGAATEQPAVRGGQIVPRLLMTANLSADHRLVDGVTAAGFLSELKSILEQPLRLALEPPQENK